MKVIVAFLSLGLSAGASLAQVPRDDKGSESPAKGAAKKDAKTAKQQAKPKAAMPTSPAPTTGSMPKSGNSPGGKLGTEPTFKGKLGTDPKPGDPQSRPPRPQ